MKSLDYLKINQIRRAQERQLKIQRFEQLDKKRRFKNRLSAIALLVVAVVSGSKAFASDVNCLSRIIYAETAGHSLEHAVAIGQAAVTKAEDDEVGICQLRGVKRKQPPSSMIEYYKVLAKQLLDKPKTTVSKGADHWNQGTKPKYQGEIKRQFDNQVLYVMTARGEK